MSVLTEADLNSKIAEADLYLQHGLRENAKDIYEEILGQLPASHPFRAQLEEKLSTSGPASFPETAPTQSGLEPEQRFNNCVGLIEAGFYSDAIDELHVLHELGFRQGAVNAKIAQCEIANDNPMQGVKHLNLALNDQTLSEEERLDVLDRLASIHEATGNTSEAILTLRLITDSRTDFRNAEQRLKIMSIMLEKFERYYHLFKEKHITEEQFDQAKQLAEQNNKDLETILINDFGIKKQQIGDSVAEFFNCPFVEYNELEIGPPPKCLKNLKEDFWRQNNCIPIRQDGKSIKIAAVDPRNQTMMTNLRSMLENNVLEFVVAFPADVNRFIDHFHGKGESLLGEEAEDVFGELADERLDFLDQLASTHEATGNTSEAIRILESITDSRTDFRNAEQRLKIISRIEEDDNALNELELVEDDEEDESEDESSATGVVVKICNRIIEEAYSRNVSDIHVESQAGKGGALIRFRVDGACSNFQTVPYNYKRALVSRIKSLAKLDTAEKRLPQDGKIKFRTRLGKNIELRVSTLPTVGGNEDVVIHILADGDAMALKKMSLLEDNLENLKTLVSRPSGLVLVAGPAGSGKTTTLHAALGHINRPEIKIWTAEDPIEIVQNGLRQVQVRPPIGLDFSRVLRAFLRADPDVIMIGETRDKETAEMVIEAALTGHLVFSTLHTNSAPETVTRLLGMGVDPFNFADSLLGVLAQRLIKRLCPHCRQKYSRADAEEKELLRREYGEHPNKPLEIPKGLTLYRPRGCTHCHKSGYKGRLAIHELLIADDNLRPKIEANAPVAELRLAAMEAGMLTLKQDGILKVMNGDTDLLQVRAATMK